MEISAHVQEIQQNRRDRIQGKIIKKYYLDVLRSFQQPLIQISCSVVLFQVYLKIYVSFPQNLRTTKTTIIHLLLLIRLTEMGNTVSILSTLSTSLPFCESDSLFLHNLQRNLHRVLVLETNFKNTNVNSRKEVKHFH